MPVGSGDPGAASDVRGIVVERLDHVELFVPDRREAAEWYERTLGLRAVPETERWAADPQGPLMVTTQQAGTKLALFEGPPQGSAKTAGFHRVAFRVSGASFAEFLSRLDELRLTDEHGRSVTRDMVVDHDLALSVYFCDPYGHRLEITTYDHDVARRRIGRR